MWTRRWMKLGLLIGRTLSQAHGAGQPKKRPNRSHWHPAATALPRGALPTKRPKFDLLGKKWDFLSH